MEQKLLFLTITFFFSTISDSLQCQTLYYEDVVNATKKPKVEFANYQASNGELFSIGKPISIGEPSRNSDFYEYILFTDGWNSSERAPATTRDVDSEIIKFKVQGSKNKGYQVIAVVQGQFTYNYWIYIEKALNVGEIDSAVLSRSEAIAKLKEAKDLLELEMMTQEEYNKLKKELEPIIRGEN